MGIRMKFYLAFFPCLLLCIAAIGAEAQAAQPHEISAFIQHPNHCAVLVGGTGHAADSADRAFGEALAAAVSSIGGSADSALSHIRTACLASPALSLAPERPKSPSSP